MPILPDHPLAVPHPLRTDPNLPTPEVAERSLAAANSQSEAPEVLPLAVAKGEAPGPLPAVEEKLAVRHPTLQAHRGLLAQEGVGRTGRLSRRTGEASG